MELRVLQYFLAVAKEQSISAAAEHLKISQPTLSRQLKDLEIELNKTLFIRGNRHITLTEEGVILRKRAEEITALVAKTEAEISASEGNIAGDIYIGVVESDFIKVLINTGKALSAIHPKVRFHYIGGDATFVYDQLDKGLIDFGLVFHRIDSTKYDSLSNIRKETWGLLLPKSAPLSRKEAISPEDIRGVPLIIARQFEEDNHKYHLIDSWLKYNSDELNIVATYSLMYNAMFMVEEGLGYAICYDRIIDTSGNSDLCFRPLTWKHTTRTFLVWKKNTTMTKAADKFLEMLRDSLEKYGFSSSGADSVRRIVARSALPSSDPFSF